MEFRTLTMVDYINRFFATGPVAFAAAYIN